MKPVMRVVTYGISDRKSAEEFLIKNCDRIRAQPGLIRVETGVSDTSFVVIYIFRDGKDLQNFRESKDVNLLIEECMNSKWFLGLDSVTEQVLDYIFY